MDKLINELKNVFPFKETTAEGDIVLIVFDSSQTMVYARVKEIERDKNKRDEWWNVKMNMLSMPPQEVTWTLREPQFTGRESFTMGGDKRFIKALDFGETPSAPPPSPAKLKAKRPALRVVK